jgi:Mrp family chromosome partitioning ATPase
MDLLQEADVAPTTQLVDASVTAQKNLALVLNRWGKIKDQEMRQLNSQLRETNLPEIRF